MIDNETFLNTDVPENSITPVAWWIHHPRRMFPEVTDIESIAEMYKENGWPVRPLVFRDTPPAEWDCPRPFPTPDRSFNCYDQGGNLINYKDSEGKKLW